MCREKVLNWGSLGLNGMLAAVGILFQRWRASILEVRSLYSS